MNIIRSLISFFYIYILLGKLRSMLIEAGSMKADEKVDSGSIIESSNNIVASTTISSNEKKMVSNMF